MGAVRSKQKPTENSAAERLAYSIPQFCIRNNISRPTYHKLRTEGRGPAEMRIGLNLIRITAEAERAWQQQMQQAGREFELRAAERAVKAADAAVKSEKHISKKFKHAISRARASQHGNKNGGPEKSGLTAPSIQPGPLFDPRVGDANERD